MPCDLPIKQESILNSVAEDTSYDEPYDNSGKFDFATLDDPICLDDIQADIL